MRDDALSWDCTSTLPKLNALWAAALPRASACTVWTVRCTVWKAALYSVKVTAIACACGPAHLGQCIAQFGQCIVQFGQCIEQFGQCIVQLGQ